MNKENESKLIKVAPKLFGLLRGEREKLWGQFAGQSTGPFHPIAFGFECGDGWFELLYEAAQQIEQEIDSLPEQTQKQIYAVQVKEKFGTLRFYMSSETQPISQIIRKAEKKSAITCEVCGAAGGLTGDHWVATLCEEHAKKN